MEAEQARRAKEAVEHYTLGPRDITFLTNRAAAYFRIGKVSPGSRSPPLHSHYDSIPYPRCDPPAANALGHVQYEECARDCDEAVKRGRELSSGSELIAKALFQKALALLELACCAADYTPARR